MMSGRHVRCAVIAGLVFLLSCEGGGPGPKAVATDYLRADYSGKRGEAYRYLSTEDQGLKTLKDYAGDQELDPAFSGVFASQVSVRVDTVIVRGDSATATASVTHPNVMAIMGDVLGTAFVSALAGDTAKMRQELAEALRKKYAGKPLPSMTTVDTLDLVREAVGWRVVRHWRAEALRVKGDSLRTRGLLREALAFYDSAMALAPRLAEVRARRDTLLAAIAIKEAKQQYIRDHLMLEHFRVGTGSRLGFGEPEPAVFGTIRNHGDSTLTRVEITVYFLGADGKPIGEKQFSPVLVTQFSFSDKGPLKPGYVRDFGYVVRDDAPSGWGRKARAEITSIQFQSEHRDL